MSRQVSWAWAALALACAAFFAIACSASNNQTSSGLGGGGANATGPGSNGTFVGSGGSAGGLHTGSGGSGTGGGDTHVCDQSCMTAGGTCMGNTCVLNENPGMVDPGTQAALQSGGSADAAFRYLYPYDGTVFPRGLIAPTLQFDGTAPDAVLLRITFTGFDYTGFYGASSPGRVKLSDAAWTALTLAAHGNDVVKVDVTKSSGGQVTGPIHETWLIAPGSLRGTIYYETYGSQLAGGANSVGIMKIEPGATQPTVVKSGCGHVCHTASADGSTLVSATSLMASASFDLTNNAAVIKAASGQAFTYGGIYPDGSFIISATHYRTWINKPSRLWDTHTGANIATPSWDSAVNHGGTPAFSPDGKFVAFNHFDTGGGHSLAVMNYDHGSNTFSNLTDIANDGQYTLAWPAFTPDSQWVVYHAGSNQQFETDAGAVGDLYAVDLATHTVVRLDAADGYGTNGQTYLPANDPHLSFAPTVLPEAVGGYFWVVFTSHRSYGNTLPSQDNGDQNGKLWVAAMDIGGAAGHDASHPAFYLDGQESGADNLRGFWVLDPCMQDGSACTSGDQCCGGFCTNMMCSSMMQGCSHEYEKCTTSGDCCDAADKCINGKCALAVPK
ncbi:MAG TPA: hypothetical protein VHB21_16485 [Minicystis sp.]|nr:hypothetical protein [Minicystis sp.]